MTRPAISVVLPTHNGSRYLDQAIGSVVGQTFGDWELLVVDDASRDGTRRIIESWVDKDPRIRGIYLERNRRLPGALNAGFRLANGRNFTWTSDDNWYRPHAFERMHTALAEAADVEIVYSRYTVVDAIGKPLREVAPGRPEDLLFGNQIGACFLYRREVDGALGGYDEQLALAEDYDFWLRASRRFRMRALDECLYCYRVHDDSLTTRRTEAVEAVAKLALEQHLMALDRDARGRALLALGAADLAHGRERQGRRRIGQAMGLGRWPLWSPGFRWVLVDLLFGTHVARSVRALRARLAGWAR